MRDGVNEIGTGGIQRRTLQDRLLDLMIERIELLNQIGSALSSQRDPMRLMEAILLGAKDLTAADGGTEVGPSTRQPMALCAVSARATSSNTICFLNNRDIMK